MSPVDAHYFSPTTPGAASFDVDVSDFIRRGRIGPLSMEAQMAAPGSGGVALDDIDSTVGHASDGILGLKQFYWNETDCPVGNRRVFTGYTFDRGYARSDSLVLGPSRKIDATLMDENAFLSFRVFAPADTDPTSSFVRPAETTIERIQALLTEVDFLSDTIFDLGYIPTTGGLPMDAHDYTGQKPFDVVNDIAQVSGWNPWVGYDETENELFLWFDIWTTDGSDTVTYDSTLKLSNVQAEHDADPDNVLLIELNGVETVDPSRVISGVWVMGKTQNVYRTRPETAYTFGWRDAVMQAQFLTDPAKLAALGDRYLLDNSTEDHRITCTVQVPTASVTAIKKGQRIPLHGTHMPSCAADFTWCRILTCTVRRDVETEEFYWLDLVLSPIVETSDGYLLAFMALRAGNEEDSGVVPHGRESCIGVTNLTNWTWLGAASAREGGNYSMFAAYRAPVAADEPMFNIWAGVGGGPRPNEYCFQIAGATAAPQLLGHSNYNGGTFVSPTVSVPGDGWLFMLLSSSSGVAPGDGGGSYAFVPVTSGLVEVDQQYAPPTFAPRSWIGYKPVTAGSQALTLTYSGSSPYAGDPGWGCLLVFVPGTDLSIVDYVLQSSAIADTCWEWNVAP